MQTTSRQGFFLSTIKGSGTAFLNAGGTVFQRELGPGEKITLDTQALVACSASVDIGVRRAGTCWMMCCGGEGLFVCVLTGPGLVIIQSMPVEKAALVYHKYMPTQGPLPTPRRPLFRCASLPVLFSLFCIGLVWGEACLCCRSTQLPIHTATTRSTPKVSLPPRRCSPPRANPRPPPPNLRTPPSPS